MRVRSRRSNFESFLEHISPVIYVNRLMKGSSSSSSPRAIAEEEERNPHIFLRDVWSAYEECSNFGIGVPLALKDSFPDVTQYYAPHLSAIQIFTNKPFVGGSPSPTSQSFGTECYLYFQFNETMKFEDRPPLIVKVDELAKQHHGLNSLSCSDLSHDSWFSVAWSPIYPIPQVMNEKALSVSFLTYHSLTSFVSETSHQDGNVKLPAFGVVTSKLFGDVWTMPGTYDEQVINIYEQSAVFWLRKLKFKHSDFDLFMAEKV